LLLWLHASRGDLLRQQFRGGSFVRSETRWSLTAPMCFLISIPIALLSPFVARTVWVFTALVPLAAHLSRRTRYPPVTEHA
jgi:hypothetical protein